MNQDEIIRYVAGTFAGVEIARPADGPGAGDTFFIYDPWRDGDPKRQMPFATIVTKDYGAFDNASNLDRPGVSRLNIGGGREAFRRLRGFPPEAAGGEGRAATDYAAPDRLLPHPVYASQSWPCVLNPGPETFETVKPLLAEAYARFADRYAKDLGRRD